MRKLAALDESNISNYLDEIPSGSDISGASDDSDNDETYYPRDRLEESSSDEDEPFMDELAPLPTPPVDGPGDALDVGRADTPPGDDPGPSEPAKKKRCVRRKGPKLPVLERKKWTWEAADLPNQPVPVSSVKPRNLDDVEREVEFFMKLFGTASVTLLAEQSNLMATTRSIERNKPFATITETEIRQTIGILLYSSVVKLPSLKLHWNTKLRNETVARVMSRNRFQEVLSNLHMADNDIQPKRGEPNHDALFKIRQLINILTTNFEEHAETEEVMSVDEMMVPYKGHLTLKVYMKNKPSKWGIKLWGLSGISGYTYKFQICGDKCIQMTPEEAAALEIGIGSSGHTVLSLASTLPPGTLVCFDNYFSSPALLLKLK